jgi:hypothetical protein
MVGHDIHDLADLDRHHLSHRRLDRALFVQRPASAAHPDIPRL